MVYLMKSINTGKLNFLFRINGDMILIALTFTELIFLTNYKKSDSGHAYESTSESHRRRISIMLTYWK